MISVEEGLARIKENNEVNALWEKSTIMLKHGNMLRLGMITAFLCDKCVEIIEILGEDLYLELLEEFASQTPQDEMMSMPDFSEQALYYAINSGAYNSDNGKRANSDMLRIVLKHTPEKVFNTQTKFEKPPFSVINSVLSAVVSYMFDDDVIEKVVNATSDLKILKGSKGVGNEEIDTIIEQRIQDLKKGQGKKAADKVWSMFSRVMSFKSTGKKGFQLLEDGEDPMFPSSTA